MNVIVSTRLLAFSPHILSNFCSKFCVINYHEDDNLLGYRAVMSRGSRPTFQRYILPSSPW
jgi:hypothetical protein